MEYKIVFATHNVHKSEEINQMLPNFIVLNLNDIGFKDEITENGTTFHENAEIKVDAVASRYEGHIFGDDSGLVIPSIGGEPGIFSARYAGTGKHADNIQKVLQRLEGSCERDAYFISVICLKFNGKKYFFEGRVNGRILKEIKGESGFGYDPVFQPYGFMETFAEMTPVMKNSISHRGIAIDKMKSFLIQHF